MTTPCACRRGTASPGHTNHHRRLLCGFTALLAVGGVAALAGCGDTATTSQTLAPVEIDRATSCELDGMLLADFPGPKAQIHYAGAPGPVFMCDTVEMFSTLLRPEQVRPVLMVYVQDMGKADWDNPRGHWMDAKVGYYVLGGKRHGSMGPTIGSFAQEADARKFMEQWGGQLMRFGEVKPEMVDLSGGALHDTRM